MKFIEISNNKFVNLKYVFEISLEEVNDKFKWAFISAISDDIFYSRLFDTKEEARQWLKNSIIEL